MFFFFRRLFLLRFGLRFGWRWLRFLGSRRRGFLNLGLRLGFWRLFGVGSALLALGFWRRILYAR